ncbi:MAG: hypothetical protein M3081_03260 [Gemmatimonadota bacterium]|nr:hypothetical protein [Gemmatimonadota bacterium]
MMTDNEAIVAVVTTSIVFGTGLTMMKLWLNHRRAISRPAVSPPNDERLLRIEQAVDAIAVEVERISEGQRFTTKLLADREAPPLEQPKGQR